MNLQKIRDLLYDQGDYAKNQIARETGLSQATVNTLLNAMEKEQEVLSRPSRLASTGRSTRMYRINEAHDSLGGMYFYPQDGQIHVHLWQMAWTGTILQEQVVSVPDLQPEQLVDIIRTFFEITCQVPVSQLVLSLCGAVLEDKVVHCDVEALNQFPLAKQVEQVCHVPVHMENDMHLSAYGYWSLQQDPKEVVSIGFFNPGVLPGTASIHKGMVIQGIRQFAGMPGFLPFGLNHQQLLEAFTPDHAREYIIKSLASLVVFINPSRILLTGSLIAPEMLGELAAGMAQSIPAEYMPQLEYVDSMVPWVRQGIYARARDLKRGQNSL